MTNTTEVWRLLRDREGEWVTRADLNFVGGLDATRRLREVREQIAASGTYRLDERRDRDRALEYRLMPITGTSERTRWVCVKCNTYPTGILTSSIDPRWKIGHCRRCGKRATFTKVS